MMQYLQLDENNFLADFSVLLPYINNMSRLQLLHMSSNSFYGTAPASDWPFVQLEEMDISYNNITGTLPSILGLATNLRLINIAGNEITGTVPSSLCDIDSLWMVVLGDSDICYPLCIHLHSYNAGVGYNTTRCQDDYDMTFCALVSDTTISSLIPDSFSQQMISLIDFSSDESVTTLLRDLDVEGAVSYNIVVDGFTDMFL
jgi:hypothetical protein